MDEEKRWPFRAIDNEWISFLKFDQKYHKDEPYCRYVSKTSLCHGLRNLFSTDIEIYIAYCLAEDLPVEIEVPKVFEDLPVEFFGYLSF